jgi:hypothetical protein
MMDRHQNILTDAILTAKSMTSDEEKVPYMTVHLLVARIMELEDQMYFSERSEELLPN